MNYTHQQSKTLGLIYTLILFIIFTNITFAKTVSTADSQMTNSCPSPLQKNGLVYDSKGKADLKKSDTSKLWYCPSLPYNTKKENPYETQLDDIDFDTGKYQCSYRFKDSQEYIQSCHYTSLLYKEIINYDKGVIDGVVDDNNNIIKEGIGTKKSVNFKDLHWIEVPLPPQMKEAQKNFNIMKAEMMKHLKDVELLKKDKAITQDLLNIRKLAYEHLVKPYYKPKKDDPITKHKQYTFSNFLAGLITLDSNVIKGYNANTGELEIQQKWLIESANIDVEYTGFTAVSEKVKTIVKWIWQRVSNLFGWGDDDEPTKKEVKTKETEELNKQLYNSDIVHSVSSYTNIFKGKIWGFYYLLNERFDIAFNTLSTTLLMLFGSWFILLGGGREGIRYAVNKGNYENGITEAGWIKAVVIISSIAAFWMSFPSSNTDIPDSSGATEQNQFKRNYTIAKKLIRKTAQSGSNTATMFSDLGLSAFLDYITHEEQIISLDNIKKELESSVNGIYEYTPALQIRNECLKYYQTTDKDFLGSSNDLNFNINSQWKSTEFAKNKNIDGINYYVCQKAFKIYAYIPYSMGESIATAKQQIDNISPKMSEAIYLLSANSVALEEQMGWVSGFSVPLTYFLMKNHEMFLTPNLDYDKIRNEAEKYMDTVLKDGNDMKRDDLIDATYDGVGYATALVTDYLNSMFLYNILPAFSSIQEKIYAFGENNFESKLKIYAMNKNNKSTPKKLLKYLKSKTMNMMSKVSSAFPPPISKWVNYLLSRSGGLLSVENDFFWHTIIYITSYIMAICIWKMLFGVIFMISVSILFLVTFIMYYAELIIHFISSLFMFLWAFTQTGKGQGEGKIVEFIRNTIVIVFAKPSMLVFGAYIFIFVYEMMMTLYAYVFQSVLTNMEATVSLMSRANGETDVMSSYGLINSMSTIAELFVNLFGFYLAYMMILKIPNHFVHKLGVNNDDASHHQNLVEGVANKHDKHINPMG